MSKCLQDMTDRQWLLFLTLLPDVGRRTLRQVLERQQVRRETPEEILRLPVETLQNEYGLPSRAIQTLREEKEQRFESTRRLEAHLTRCGVRWISFQDAAYPDALDDMPEPPPVLFLYGNHSLLQESSYALLASHTVSAQGLHELELLANALLEQGITPIVSATQPAYQRALLCAVRRSAPYILVLDRGLLSAFGEDLRKEPLKQARIWQAEFNTERALALSPFRPRDGWVASSGRYRDALIGYLASVVFVVEARPDGYIVHLCRELLRQGRTVYVMAQRSSSLPGNQLILEAGGTPFGTENL
ncbi:MAG: DNA-processing protein DprA [Fimbriimonadales bacterium]|nr:DNA-processing protein DprA [Fimbriimonadales bacterium]